MHNILFLVMEFIMFECYNNQIQTTPENAIYRELLSGAKIKQSKECTSEEIDNNIQCFQEIPKAVYEVAQGSVATLTCIVRNQHGKVQWRAVPFLLGYDRNIPGKKRYKVVGSAVKGEHFLEIRNVKVKDAGTYECQVQPVGQLHPLLRRKTKLVVLVRPTQPKIFYHNIKPNNDQAIINALKPDVRSSFACVSLNGQPKIKFIWFLNNVQIKDGVDSSIVENSTDTRSKMSVLTNKLKDGDVIKCRVSNRATEVNLDPERQSLETEVVVVIHNPPSPPKYTEMTQSQTGSFLEGEIFKATCSSSPPGKPVGNILWRWKIPKSRELFNNQVENYTVKDISPQYYQQLLTNNELLSKLELPLSILYHGAQLFCIVSNTVTSYQSVAVKIFIKYPPSAVVISVSDGSMRTQNLGTEGLTETVVFGEEGEQKTITCTTALYYNEAMIKWQFYQNPDTSQIFQQPVSFVPIEKVWKEDENYRRNSTIKVTISKQFDKGYLDCQAWSGGKRVDSRVKLDITYPPEKPVITGYHNQSPVKLNHALEMTCSTSGGNPFPELKWIRENKPIESSYSPEQIGNQNSLKIKIFPTIADNNVKYFCQAKSVALKNSALNSNQVTLTVLFPPMTIGLKSISGPDVEDGNVLTLQCTAGESNPPAAIRWKINQCGQMMSLLGRRPIRNSCVEEILSTSSQKSSLGKFGGSIVRSKLEWRPNWKHHLDYIDCEIYNPDYGEEYQVLRKRIQINVTFPPQFEEIMSKQFVIEEGRTQTINLEPIANPPVQRFSWFKGNIQLESNLKTKSLTLEKAKLIVTRADTKDMGNYSIAAVNERGEARITIFLNITYKPIIIGDQFETIVSNHQNADLECSVRANPAIANLSYKWVKLVPPKGLNDISLSDLVADDPISCNQAKWKGAPEKSNLKYFSKCTDKSQFEMSSSLIVYDTDRNDVGLYKCIINNGISGDVVKTIELLKDFTPQILVIPKYLKAAGSLGKTVTLFCFIRAEPQPSVLWYFGRYNSSINSNFKYRLNTTRYRPGFYVAQLNILDLQRSDHGNFICKAENLKGSDSRKIEVSGTSVPDIPLELQVINKSVNSIEISWMQGFDGGSVQTFQVRWKEKDTNSLYRYEDVASDDSKSILTFIITGLKSGTLYHISVNSRNPKHGNSAFSKTLTTSTSNAQGEVDSSHITYPIPSGHKLQDNTILFIVAASVFGFIILVVNILVIIFVLRRRRQRSRTAKFEARYKNPKSLLSASNGLILSRDDSIKDSNYNYMRNDMVELYPRGLDSSQILHHNPHQIHSLRRPIPDDQKTFSSFETGSDDAREDLIRRQKEFGCCGIDPNSQKGSIIVAYDPVTNSSYYAPVSAGTPTPIFLQHGMYDQDTMSTLLSPIHEGNQRQLMTFLNMIPVNGQRNSSSCGSVHSGGNCSNNQQYMMSRNISPTDSVAVTEANSTNNFSNNTNNNFGSLNGGLDITAQINSFNSNTINNTPYRSRIVSPPLMNYNIGSQSRESYANELRRAQLSGNILVNPAIFTPHSTTNSHMTELPPHMVNSSGQSSSIQVLENTVNHAPVSSKNSDSQFNSIPVPMILESKMPQKHRCTDNGISIQNQNSDRSMEFINPVMDTSFHQNTSSDSQYLPRPNMI